MEQKGRERAKEHFGLDINNAGLFISPDDLILAASPDGYIGPGRNHLLEIKTLSAKRNLSVLAAKPNFLKINEATTPPTIELKKKE